MAIGSIKHKGLRRYFVDDDKSGVQQDQVNKLDKYLNVLDAATDPSDAKHLSKWHPLTGKMKGKFSIRITGNWRLVYGWDYDRSEAIEVNIVDYH